MIRRTFQLDLHWPTQEPFLFCAHHNDQYPVGNEGLGPDPSLLQGRNIGQDFEVRDGFRMYHGQTVPGFPVHPHRGFETITIVRKGYVDHADSLGAAGRYGEGDVQWMTAGDGIQHSEMFPLLNQDSPNHVELFQIWLNLPQKSKKVLPHFKMFWSETIPRSIADDSLATVSVIAGEFGGVKAIEPPPDSWAADPANDVLILLVKLSVGGSITLPSSGADANRTIYFFSGTELLLDGQKIAVGSGNEVASHEPLTISSPHHPSDLLVLQAKPIGEPVVQHGPFVMNSREEILRTFDDYRRTQFGGWPWLRPDMVHGSAIERFAKLPDGTIEHPPGK